MIEQVAGDAPDDEAAELMAEVVTAADLIRFTTQFADLADEDVMRQAWS